jgi:DNA-binding beta-propeller fold protein YncE
MNRRPQKGIRVIKLGRSARSLLRRGSGDGRAYSEGFGGIAASSLKQFALSVAMAVVVLLLAAGHSSGARPHEFTTTIGEHCTTEPCEGAKLLDPTAVAVNEASGDIYVLDKGEPGQHGRVVRFSQAGGVLGEFDGSGLLAGEGTEAGAGGREGESGGAGTKPGERGVPTGRFEEPGAIAVDNSCALRGLTEFTTPTCAAADPSNGDVYVADTGEGHTVIDKYNAAGQYVGQITTAGVVEFQILHGVAVDPKGTVWVYSRLIANTNIYQFTNAQPNVFVSPEVRLQPFGALALQSRGFAVDSSDNFYGAVFLSGIPRTTKWDHEGEVLIPELGSGEPTGVAVEQISDASVVDTGTHLTVFSPGGSENERLGEEGGAQHLQAGAGIGVNAAEGILYVADPLAGPVVVFGPAQPTAPKVEGQSFSGVGAHEAAVAAEINPSSLEGEAATEYRFEYGRCASPGTCAVSGYEASVPVPDALIAASFEVAEVTVELERLAANTTYHFRAVARNSHGEGAPGAELDFTTQAEGGNLLLPDSRQWQLVSPPDKRGAQIEPLPFAVVQAAADGSAITYLANAPTEAEPEGYTNQVQLLSRRGTSGWSSRDIAIPHPAATGQPIGAGPEYKFFDPDLTLGAVQPFGEFAPELSSEASESTAYLHDLGGDCGSSCYRPLVTGKAGFANVPEGTVFGESQSCIRVCGPRFLGATEDLSHVVLKAEDAALTPGSEAAEGLYEWTAGASLAPVSVLPGQTGASGRSSLGSPESVAAQGAISADGNLIVWTKKAFSNEEVLYLRDMASGRTVQLDGAGCGTCEAGNGRFQFAVADGSRVFFTSNRRLTADSGAVPDPSGPEGGKHDLYECRIALIAGEPSCDLTDLTPARGGEAADVQGSVLGSAKDGSAIYLVARGILTEKPNARNQRAQAGGPNLYLLREGATEFVTTLSGEDLHDWQPFPVNQPTRVSGDGRYLAFMSQASLTGYDNRDRATGRPVAEVYLYDARTGRLGCASCDPSGERPVGIEYRKIEAANKGLVGGFEIWPENALVAANVPGWTSMTSGSVKSRHQPRYLSDSGRLIFNTLDSLVPQDSNGTQDVYEYEPPGVGNCDESLTTYSARSGGCVSLISSGSSNEESAFLDASESGDDVFFLTSANLASQDIDAARDVYDAHACSAGSPCLPEPVAPAAACEGTACQTATPPAAEPTAATPGFTGPGNEVQCRKGQVKKAGKCVKKKQAKKQKKKHHKKKSGKKSKGKKSSGNGGSGGKK